MIDPLNDVLQRWRPEPAQSPDFRAKVWARIAGTEVTPTRATLLPFRLILPLAASLAIIASVATGVGAGLTAARAQTTDRMAAAYAQSIDPILKSTSDHVHAP